MNARNLYPRSALTDITGPTAPIDEPQALATHNPKSASESVPPVRLDELAIPALLVIIGAYLVYGLRTMDIPTSAVWPGPDFFPAIVTIIIFVVAAVLTAQTVRGYRLTRAENRQDMLPQPSTDWRAFATVIASFLVFAATLLPLGWVVAGMLLFWGVARALGSRRMIFDLLLALGMSSMVQLAFSAGLGLRLPPGIFGWF